MEAEELLREALEITKPLEEDGRLSWKEQGAISILRDRLSRPQAEPGAEEVRDARRYQFLRNQSPSMGYWTATGKGLDVAVDNALAATQKEGKKHG